MPEPLRNSFGPDVPARIAATIAAVHPTFPTTAFLEHALAGYGALELTQRAGQIADALHAHLPQDDGAALGILLASLDQPLEPLDGGMGPFIYLPHVLFVGRYGLDAFELSMRVQYELTKRFTAEFSIRPFLERYPDRTLRRLRDWATDPNVHVRRLVSEGTRPRLPWAPRLRMFQEDPAPVLSLLEMLKDDPEEYVRRSVANNLNDIGKDHPELVVKICSRWMQDPNPERIRLIRHALRSLTKAGHPGALAVLGFGTTGAVEVGDPTIDPGEARIGDRVTISFTVTSLAEHDLPVRVDLRVHYPRARGKTSAKVFQVGTSTIRHGGSATFRKTISLAQMTTRRHFSGPHRVEALVNGEPYQLGSFRLFDQDVEE